MESTFIHLEDDKRQEAKRYWKNFLLVNRQKLKRKL
jgi:hypothetical protein